MVKAVATIGRGRPAQIADYDHRHNGQDPAQQRRQPQHAREQRKRVGVLDPHQIVAERKDEDRQNGLQDLAAQIGAYRGFQLAPYHARPDALFCGQ